MTHRISSLPLRKDRRLERRGEQAEGRGLRRLRPPHGWPSLLCVPLLLVAVGNGCDDNGGPGGSGGTGGGSTGGTTIVSCNPAQCPEPSSECKVAACSAQGACIEKDAPDGQPASAQVEGDCKQNVCQKGQPAAVNDGKDVENDGQDCTTDSCEAGLPKHEPTLEGKCEQAGGKVCDAFGSGTCVGCNVDLDCEGDPEGKTFCDDAQVCVVPDCLDAEHNGAETDVDCGGPDCAPCLEGSMCEVDADCLSTVCSEGTCHKNPLGAACGDASECESANCVDAVCCDTPCSGICESCSGSKNGAGVDGQCGWVINGLDPDNDCPQDPPSTCQFTGQCFAGACAMYPPTTKCGFAVCIGPSTIDPDDFCTGDGTCLPGPMFDCWPYACTNGYCPWSCIADAECLPGFHCSKLQCVPQ
ncbi:MAG: hypothetical protein IPK82_33855 [Polyangiaceae bacterium]|nr:hypothetical protein [Polyangiaceae bacterium]